MFEKEHDRHEKVKAAKPFEEQSVYGNT